MKINLSLSLGLSLGLSLSLMWGASEGKEELPYCTTAVARICFCTSRCCRQQTKAVTITTRNTQVEAATETHVAGTCGH